MDMISNINWLLQAYCEKELGGVIVNLLGSNFTCDSPEKEVLIKPLYCAVLLTHIPGWIFLLCVQIELFNDMPGSYSVNITILCPRCEDICWVS